MTRLRVKAARGIGAIVFAVFKACPQLNYFHLTGSGPDSDIFSEVVDGMLEAAGRAGKGRVVYGAVENDDGEEDEEEDEDEEEEEWEEYDKEEGGGSMWKWQSNISQ